MTQLDPKELRFHLQSLFLCCGSVMAAAVEALTRCYRFKLTLEVTGKGNSGYGLFVQVARKLGIESVEVDISAKNAMKYFAWISDQTTKSQRAWVPGEEQREGDLHVMLPFYLRYHLAELRKNDPSFPSPTVDNLYVMLIWAEHFGINRGPVSNRILKDIVAWETLGQLTVHHYVASVSDEIRTVYRKAWELPDLAQLYLGFCGGAEGRELVRGKETVSHPFNVWGSTLSSAMSIGSGTRSSPMPCLVNRFVWSIDEIAVITKNAWALKSHGDTLAKNDRQRVRKCLLSRLQGKAEAEILRDLAFESQEEYYKWQVSRAIDIDHRRLSDPFDNWLKACSYFELDPNLEALEECQGHQPESSDGHKVDVPEANADLGARGNQAQITALEACEFRHSPDFRSVVATSGKSFVLTAKQAHMVQILHSAWLNGTPELSQGHLIEEVFGEVAENRLKRLFAYDEAWSQLFESGSRKGLIRLKVLPSETQS